MTEEGTQNKPKCLLPRSRRTNKIKIILCPMKRREEDIFAITRTQKFQLRKNNFFHDACEQLFKDEKNYIIEKFQIYNASYGERKSLKTTNQET